MQHTEVTTEQAPKFYGYFRSSSSYRCRIAFNLKGVQYDFTPVHLKNGAQKEAAFAALNPQELLPVLVTPTGAVLRQSLAILEWLEETHPEVPLLPVEREQRALVRGFAQAIACEIHPLQNLRVLQHLRGPLGCDDAQVTQWLHRWIGDGLAACEALLNEAGTDTRFCFGDSPGLADICLVPQVFSAERFGVDITGLHRVREVCNSCNDLEAFAAAHPAQQPDYEP